MFCQNCGSEIRDDAKFCPNCGEKNYTISVSSYQRNDIVKKEGNYNREVLKQYLSDLRALECIKAKLESELNDIDNRTNSLANPGRLGVCPSGSGIDWEESVGAPLAFAAFVLVAGILLNFVGNWLFNSNIVFIIGLVIALIIMGFGGISVIADYSEQKTAIENYMKAKKNDDERVAREEIEKNQLIKTRESLYDEYCELCELLDKGYSVNIVPQQFRNLYAVYYLCEFIMTSNESFSNALLQCNLDEIKNQLATVIENQQEIIINQAIMIAQNEQIMEQNNRSIKHIAQIETDTALAAKYSQVAAVNAEACAWIGVANYIKD